MRRKPIVGIAPPIDAPWQVQICLASPTHFECLYSGDVAAHPRSAPFSDHDHQAVIRLLPSTPVDEHRRKQVCLTDPKEPNSSTHVAVTHTEVEGIGWPEERDWLRKGRKTGKFSNEDDRIGQDFVVTREKSVGNGLGTAAQ